jgi:adenylate cyclase
MKPQQDVRRPFSDEALLRQGRVFESNVALSAVSLVVFGLVIMGLLALSMREGAENPVVLWRFLLLALVLSTAMAVLTYQEQLRGWVAYAVLVPFASLPTLFFLLCHGVRPAEAATYFQGPLPYVYFVTVAVTGLALDFWLTTVCTVLAAAGFEYCLVLTQGEGLQESSGLLTPAHSQLEPLILLLGGLLVAAMAATARQLVFHVLDEARVETTLGRLFGKYIREEAKERLLNEPQAFAGERREVAVLCADLRDFHEYSRSTAPQELVHQLNTYFDAMVQSITLRGGAIDRFAGDCLVATFGGMVSVQAPCILALEAAREMRIRLALLNTTWKARGRGQLDNNISLHVGEVVLGNIGSARHRDFTLVGSPVTTALRVGALPREPGHPIILTEAFHARLPATMKALCRTLGLAQVPGSRAPLELHGVPEGPNTPLARVTGLPPDSRDTLVTWE